MHLLKESGLHGGHKSSWWHRDWQWHPKGYTEYSWGIPEIGSIRTFLLSGEI